MTGKERLLYRESSDLTLHDVAPDGRTLIGRDDMRAGVVMLGERFEHPRDLASHGPALNVDVSQDGSRILTADLDYSGARTTPAVYLRRTDGSPAVNLGEGNAMALSPDGKWALAIEHRSHRRLIVHPTGPGESRVVGPELPYRWATWFPDNRRILAAVADPATSPRVYAIDGVTGAATVLADDATLLLRTHGVSPDGRQFFARGLDGKYRIYQVQGGVPRVVPELAPLDHPARWTPGGKAVFVHTRTQSPARVWSVDVESGSRTLVQEFVPADTAGQIPGSLLPSADGRAFALQYVRWLSDLYLMDPL